MAGTIGAGPMSRGEAHPTGRAEYPVPYAVGTPIGEFLRVESLLRVAPDRLFQLVNNLGPKWKSRKCWACGNKFIPDGSRCCGYCLTPLRDLRMLMTVRWDADGFRLWEQVVARRLAHFGLHTPVALYYRDQRMLSVHHFDGERFLIDEPGPWPADRLLTGLHFLATVVDYLHIHGIVLGSLDARNVLVMPDDTVRLFDLDAIDILDNPRTLSRHPSQPGLRMSRALGELGLHWCAADAHHLRGVLQRARAGHFETVVAFAKELEKLYHAGAVAPTHPRGAVMSDMGLIREHNEDQYQTVSLAGGGQAILVADGMGGHHGGEIASALACDAAAQALATATGSAAADLTRALEAAFRAANHAVFQAQTPQKKMGTTLVGAAVHRSNVAVGNTGDSRAYLLRGGALQQVSRDHTVGQDLVDAGRITREQARTHPRGNLLTASIGGPDDDLDVFTWQGELRPGDRLLLCSDGLWGFVDEPVIAQILAATPGEREAAHALVRAAIDVGAPDNVTVAVIDG